MSDYRVIVRVQNGRIFERIKKAGFKNIAEFCRANDLSSTLVGELLNMKKTPALRDGSFRKITIDIANALGSEPADLFTERQYEAIPSNVRDFLIEENQMAQLMASDSQPDRLLALSEMADGIQSRARLTEREQIVIDMRYKNDMSISEIANAMDLSPSRIQQIEAKAMRKMRHPIAVKDIVAEDIY